MISNREILKYFPQPIFRYKVENYKQLNKELSDYIYKLNKEDKEGVVRSNRGGWHSKPFELKDKNSIQTKFALETTKYIFDAIKNYGWKLDPAKTIVTEMWAIINKPNDFNVTHTHPNSYLSAAYYVKAPKKCGKFIIENPLDVARHSHPVEEQKTEFNIKVAGLEIEEGELLIFPAYLLHSVSPNQEDKNRVSVSFNFNLE